MHGFEYLNPELETHLAEEFIDVHMIAVDSEDTDDPEMEFDADAFAGTIRDRIGDPDFDPAL